MGKEYTQTDEKNTTDKIKIEIKSEVDKMRSHEPSIKYRTSYLMLKQEKKIRINFILSLLLN